MRRRGRGEGGLTQRKDGRWQASYTDNTGKRRYLYAKTRRQIVERLAEALREKEHGLYGPEQTVAAYLADWLERASIRPISRKRYATLIRLHVNPQIGHLQMRKVTPQHISALLRAMDRSPATIGQVRHVLSGAFQEALEWRQILTNPIRAVHPPKAERHEMTALAEADIRRLLTAVRDDPLEALYVMAVLTGMRQGELLALRWQDVDLERGMLDVNATLTRMDGAWQRTPPKTRSSVRQLPIPAEVLPVLKAHRLRVAEALIPYRARTEGDVLVFLEGGRAINGFHLTERQFKPLLRRAGLPVIRFHDLRHTAATHMLRNGIPVHVVSRYLGHATVSTTLDTYSHVIPGDMESAAAVMGRLMVAG